MYIVLIDWMPSIYGTCYKKPEFFRSATQLASQVTGEHPLKLLWSECALNAERLCPICGGCVPCLRSGNKMLAASPEGQC